jgi:exoribonuclease-2
VQHGVAAKLVAPFKPKDADLFAVVQGFDDTYAAYADHQRHMEYFWCLRWLTQEQKKEVVAAVVKGDLVRLEEVPLLLHVPGLGVHARGTRIVLEVMAVDELTVEASVRPIRVLDAPGAGVPGADALAAEEEEEDAEIVDAPDASALSEEEARAEEGGKAADSTDSTASADSADQGDASSTADDGAPASDAQGGATRPAQVTQ